MSNPWIMSVLVGLGGFAGSVARYHLSLTSQRFSIEWPLGTMAANVLGCFIIGVIMALSARGETISPAGRLALATGFCGGFTTMSSMIYESGEMLRASEYLHAGIYVSGTLLLSMAAFFAGMLLVHVIFRTGGGSWN
jgi:fluoride exporter